MANHKTFTEEKRILIMMNGGTIDAESYRHSRNYTLNGEAPVHVRPLKMSLIPPYLKSTPHGKFCSFHQMKMQDSKDFTHADIDELTDFVRNVDQPVILITYGTDAMADTAREMAANLRGQTAKTVIFTGAMEPLSHGKTSDGFANLDYAVSAGLHGKIPPGVYVAMPDEHNKHRVFKADDALKKNIVPRTDSPEGRMHKYFTGHALDLALGAPSLTL